MVKIVQHPEDGFAVTQHHEGIVDLLIIYEMIKINPDGVPLHRLEPKNNIRSYFGCDPRRILNVTPGDDKLHLVFKSTNFPGTLGGSATQRKAVRKHRNTTQVLFICLICCPPDCRNGHAKNNYLRRFPKQNGLRHCHRSPFGMVILSLSFPPESAFRRTSDRRRSGR